MKHAIVALSTVLLLSGLWSCNPSEKGGTQETSQLPDSLKGTFWDYTLTIDQRVDDLVSKMSLEEKVSQMLHESPAIPRLRVPAYNWWNEGLHGVARYGKATVFPQPIGMASSFDEDLIQRVADAISTEGRAIYNATLKQGYEGAQYSGLTYWSPNINIFRDPRWGRGMETWGEDPWLTGRMGAAFVKGIQGNDSVYLKAAACAKHYVVHSGPEGDRHKFNAVPPIKDFYETYLPAFEMLVKEGQVEAIMCAYNRTFDEPCCGSNFLLNKIIRQDWGFKGHILSDCGALTDFHDPQGHKVTKSPAESAALALKSGLNLSCGEVYKNLTEAVKLGLITEAEIDANLKQLLRTRFKLGLFDPTDRNPYNRVGTEVIGSESHRNLAKEAALKSMVLLKNNGVLPLKKNLKHLFITGPTAANVDAMLGNYNGVSDNVVTYVEGIAGKMEYGVRCEYRHGFLISQPNVNQLNYAVGEAKWADAVVVVMGINPLFEGEEGESLLSPHKSDRPDIQLPEYQIDFLRQIRQNEGKPIIVVLTGGSPLAFQEVFDLADAVIFAWYSGEQGGNALADIIFGDASPSGRLPITFPSSVSQLPPYTDYSMAGRTYKYMTEAPFLPFGFGLTYTTFEYTGAVVSQSALKNGDAFEMKVKLKNTGKVKADEVVQLYVTDVEAGFRVPQYALKAFKRVSLAPGETTEVIFQLTTESLQQIDEQGNTVLEPGEYKITVGGCSPGARGIALGAPKPVEVSVRVE